MNDDPNGGGGAASFEGLDDPAVLAEIEAEFAELTAEIDRISALPTAQSPEKAALLKGLREQWLKKSADRGDRPEWREKIDDVIGEAVSKILEDGLQQTPDGKLAFELQGDSLKTHGQPVLNALLGGFQGFLAERFPPAGSEPAAKPAATDDASADGKTSEESEAKPGPSAAPQAANPMSGLMSGIGQLFADAMRNVDFTGAQTKTKTDAKTTTDDDGTTKVAASTETEATIDLKTGIAFDTRKGDTAPVALQNLFKGLGMALNQTLKGVGAAAKDAVSNLQTPTVATAEPPEETEKTTSDVSAEARAVKASSESDEAHEPVTDTDASEPAKPKVTIDFAGLFGQLLKNVKPVASTTATPPKPAEPTVSAEAPTTPPTEEEE